MSFLCDKTLEQLINNNTIGNNNVNIDQKFQLGPCSVDLKLSRYIAINKYKHFAFIRWLFAPFDVKSTQESIPYLKEHVINVNKGYVMKPGELIYAHSIESVSMPNDKFGIVIGRSSYSRLGLEVNLTNILHQPGHNGVILFQIKNNSSFRVRIYAEMRIAQILIGHLDNPCSKGQDDTDNAKYKAELEPSLIKCKKD
jgi:dCTP deaminase